MSDPSKTAVEVNEARIWATQGGADWWRWFMARFSATARVEAVKTSLGGDVHRIAMDDREHAKSWIENAVRNGIPSSALKVVSVKFASGVSGE